MALYHRNSEKRRIYHEFRRQEEEVIGSLCRLGSRPISPKTQLEQEKRIRREIANSNERRRMQSINAGFQSLRTLLPQHEGEKLSKAAILQHTAEFIYQLEQEKTRLLAQNSQLKRLLSNQMNQDSDGSSLDSPLPKRKKTETESSDEGIETTNLSEKEVSIEDIRREMIELRVQLERERRLRMILEEQTRNMEVQLYPERIREVQYKQKTVDNPKYLDPHGQLHQIVMPVPLTKEVEVELEEELEEDEEETRLAEMQIMDASEPSLAECPEDLSGKNVVALEREPVATLASPAYVSSIEIGCHSIVSPEDECQPDSEDESLPSQLYHASTSRQNLETIVEAIRHLEGDHLFSDDPTPPPSADSSLSDERDANVQRPLVTIPSGGHEYAIRQQVIHCSQQHPRPGVIVTNHS